MKCLVEIEMDGDAFQPIARLELARILEDLARRVRYIGAQDGMKLKAVDEWPHILRFNVARACGMRRASAV